MNKNDYYDSMHARARFLTERIGQLETLLKKLPKGSLEIRKKGNHILYYLRNEDKKTYLAKEKEASAHLIYQLAAKKYLQQMIIGLREEAEAIKKYIQCFVEKDRCKELLDKHPDLERILSPLIGRMNQKGEFWANASFESTAGYEENRIHQGCDGKYYRSKSEAIIADALYERRIPFRYEWDKKIDDRIYHIDFTIMHPETEELIYWEHCGRMDDPQYAFGILQKLKNFEKADIILDKNLILTFETMRTPFSGRTADKMVERWFGKNLFDAEKIDFAKTEV